ncbi:hypothetical protein L1987_56939 [Smallanthus sonchifolius]|uniref:Uncharacterized protein n=1 Tax=Smallanthus sonchifolius TaxID=185202 RepID=A0ACB9DBA9_9ASTR|nr:hypothetical protein L1987_56939 [Smallanthus sonchifolius]
MDIGPPPPPLFSFQPPPIATTTSIPQAYNNGGTATDDVVPHHHHSSLPTSSSPTSSVIIVMIVISSAIIVSASIYLLIRFLSRRCNRSFRTTFSPADDVVFDNRNENEHVRHHVISIGNIGVDSLPLFTFSSLTGKIAGGDCAVCLSKFEDVDLVRLLPLCCHAFHADCIDAWLKSNQTCPLCRSTVNPTEADILNTLGSGAAGGVDGNRSNSFRIEIGTISQRRDPSNSNRRSYSVGSYDYVLDDGYEIPVESTHRSAASDCTSVDKDSTNPEPPGENLAAEVAGGVGSGRFSWLRDYVDRVSASLSTRTLSLRGSGRFFTGSSRRSESINDFEATHGRIGEEISELFRWLSGV